MQLAVDVEDQNLQFDYTKVTYVIEAVKPVNTLDSNGDFLKGLEVYFLGGTSLFLEGWRIKRWKELQASITQAIKAQQGGIIHPNQMSMFK